LQNRSHRPDIAGTDEERSHILVVKGLVQKKVVSLLPTSLLQLVAHRAREHGVALAVAAHSESGAQNTFKSQETLLDTLNSAQNI
jgi:hypothetical protein